MNSLELDPSKDPAVLNPFTRIPWKTTIGPRNGRYRVFKHIPHHLVHKILIRTPAKSLVKFQSVCKAWNSLFNNPEFIQEHFYHTTKDQPYSFLVFSQLQLFEKRFYLTSFDHEDDGKSKNGGNHEYWKSNLRIAGENFEDLSMLSCNSLICLTCPYGNSNIYICNPATQEFINLASVGGIDGYGFGFDAVTNEYKVVVLRNDHRNEVLMCGVFTLGTESWRTIYTEGALFFIGRAESPIFVDGLICWCVTFDTFILCFDVGDEKFKSIPTPEGVEQSRRKREEQGIHICLAELKEGKLCFVEHNVRKEMLEIWTLKVEMEKGIFWIKEYSVKLTDLQNWPQYRITPLCIQNKKMLLESTWNGLVSYDMESQKFVTVFKPPEWFQILAYKESLIRLHDILSPPKCI